MSENHQNPAAQSANNETEAQAEKTPFRSQGETDRDRGRNQRIEAVKAEVADAAALRTKMIQAMRRRLENEARNQAGRRSCEHEPSEPGETFRLLSIGVPAQHLAGEAEPPPAVYPIARPAQTPSKPYEGAAGAPPPYQALHDSNEIDSIFAPESPPASLLRPELGATQPRSLTGGNPEIWDEAFESAQRVENALARLREALARDENLGRRAPRAGKAKSSRSRRPRPWRVVTLFATSFMIGISATILIYDWHWQTSVEKRLTQLIGELWPAKTTAVATNEVPLPAVKPAEKPLAAAANAVPKSLATVKLEAFDAAGKADTDIPLSIHAIGASPDQSVDIRLAGLPGSAELSAGRRQADGSWLLKPSEQSGLTLQVPSEASGNLKLTVEAWEHNTGELAAPPQEIRVGIAPASIVVEPAASAMAPVASIREAPPVPSVPPKLPVAAEPPAENLKMAAIEEAAEAPAMALGIDDPSRPLMARGDALMELGDVVSARSFYDRAFDLGNLRAARSIARTYDPMVLASMKVQGLRADPAKAIEWYRRAERAGEPEATQAIAALETLLGQ